MGLIDLFNQWIVERGAAVVHEKHIALFRDQLIAADKRILELESENAVLKKKLQNSVTKSEQLAKENNELAAKIKSNEKPTHTPSIDEAQVNIL